MAKTPCSKISTAALLLLMCLLFPLTAHAKGVILNFTDVDIATMVKFISDLTGKNFVMDEKVKGKISVYSPSKLSNEEAFNVFTSVLELKGFTLIQAGRVYKIVPTSSAKQSGTKLYGSKDKIPVNESYVARVITLENIPAQDAVTFLQPLVSKDGHVSAFGASNMLLVVDSSINIQKLIAIVDLIDAEKRRDLPEVMYLKSAGAENVAKVLQDWIGSRSAKQPGQTAAPSVGTTIVPDIRLNAILVFGAEKDKEEIRKLVALVDVAPPTTSSKVNVYPLENADATEVAKVLDGVIKGMVATQPGQPAGAATQQSPFDSGKITVTPDKASNALIIMASPTDYQNILQVVQKLDKRRRQVSVQAVIAEVSLDKLQELGVQWGGFGGGSTASASAAGIYDPFGTISSLLATVSALNQGGVTNTNLDLKTPFNFTLMLKALQSNDIINVLSNPTILTSDNKEAEIFVGENVPFLGTSTIGTGGVSQQSVDRKDTGLTLKLTPQINEGDYIKLDISEEISAVKDVVTLGAGSTDRSTTKRSAKTSVVVKNNETVAIGGLINESDEVVVSKVPLLGDIPLLGWFFKTKSVKKKKTNLILLLTPRMIKDERDMAESSARQKELFNNAVKRTEPLDMPNEPLINPQAKPTASNESGTSR